MATLENVQMGWKALEDVINRLIQTINGNEPLEGSGIRIVDTSNGKLISVASETTSQSGSGAGAGGGGGAQEPHVLVNGTVWHGVKWEQVTVVDPSTCAQSTIKVMRFTGDYVNDSITIPFGTYAYWATPITGQ